MQLSAHFSLAELTAHEDEPNLDNTPDAEHLARLKVTAWHLEAVRTLLGHPMTVDSGYRSPAVNAAVGGVADSAHALGYACDFLCPGFGDPYTIARAISGSGIQYDQLIQERGAWVHISFDPRMRHQNLSMDTRGNYHDGIIKPSVLG